MYIDGKIKIINGMYCSCSTRKDKVYDTVSKFTTHTKTKTHQKWLKQLNDNKANYYVEMLKMKEINENQQKIIQNMENKLLKRTLTIDYLTSQLTLNQSRSGVEFDLLDIN
jgi:hypothetical protein